MATPRIRRRLPIWGLSGLTGGLLALISTDASAAGPGKRFRFHGETDPLGFTHFNPDGDGDNLNAFGFGFGRKTGVDTALLGSVWGLGFGYLFPAGNVLLGARFTFVVNTLNDGDGEDGFDVVRTTFVAGQLVPYFRYLFLAGRKIRPFVQAHFGLGGTTVSRSADDRGDFQETANTVGPIVGFGGGAHFLLTEFFSLDAGLMFDYYAPHTRIETTRFGETEVDDYDKDGDGINLAAQLGFSVWF